MENENKENVEKIRNEYKDIINKINNEKKKIEIFLKENIDELTKKKEELNNIKNLYEDMKNTLQKTNSDIEKLNMNKYDEQCIIKKKNEKLQYEIENLKKKINEERYLKNLKDTRNDKSMKRWLMNMYEGANDLNEEFNQRSSQFELNLRKKYIYELNNIRDCASNQIIDLLNELEMTKKSENKYKNDFDNTKCYVNHQVELLDNELRECRNIIENKDKNIIELKNKIIQNNKDYNEIKDKISYHDDIAEIEKIKIKHMEEYINKLKKIEEAEIEKSQILQEELDDKNNQFQQYEASRHREIQEYKTNLEILINDKNNEIDEIKKKNVEELNQSENYLLKLLINVENIHRIFKDSLLFDEQIDIVLSKYLPKKKKIEKNNLCISNTALDNNKFNEKLDNCYENDEYFLKKK
eukprot:GHVL01000743.1.p2 GENE.GHVL01000743.1~~GHVL01000743.1.p2  ORF type:complete len:411 (+),score=175.31 GHVL01000743.1:2997-4229(+)